MRVARGADILEHADQHSPATVQAALAVAGRVLTESISPWYTQTWADVDPVDPPPHLPRERLLQNLLAPIGDVQPATTVARTGYCADDVAVVVAASRTPTSHLHHDGGHLTLGWQERWWITDPGYQQYRLGAERDFTIGPLAHNAPVLDGLAQSSRAVKARARELPAGHGNELDLTACYAGLPAGAHITRQVHLRGDRALVVDRFTGLSPGTSAGTDARDAGALARHPGTRGRSDWVSITRFSTIPRCGGGPSSPIAR